MGQSPIKLICKKTHYIIFCSIKHKYYKDSKEAAYETKYVFNAINHFYNIDKCILVGTAGSDWYSLYENLYEKDSPVKPSLKYDVDYAATLLEIDSLNKKFDLDVFEIKEKLTALKESMGGFCLDIIVLKYGINSDELLMNFSLITKISEYINDKDSIYFDLTHSFRSLPVYELLAINYLKDALKKKVNIELVSYAMLEISRETGGYTPIVDLTELVNVLDWIKAAEEYNRFGTAYLLAEILEKSDGKSSLKLSKESVKALKLLGDTISANVIGDFKKLIVNIGKILKNASYKESAFVVVDSIFKDLDKRFSKSVDDDFILQLELSKWHFDKKRYFASAITLIECLLNLCCSVTNENRDTIRAKLSKAKSSDSVIGQFLSNYNKIREIRNRLSHADTTNLDDIKTLKTYADYFAGVYRNQLKVKEEYIQALISALS